MQTEDGSELSPAYRVIRISWYDLKREKEAGYSFCLENKNGKAKDFLFLQITVPHEFLSQSVEISLVSASHNINVKRSTPDCENVIFIATYAAAVNRNQIIVRTAFYSKTYFYIIAKNYGAHAKAVRSYSR